MTTNIDLKLPCIIVNKNGIRMRVQVMNRSLSGKEEGSSSGVIAERKSLFKDLRLEERTRLEIDID